MKKVILSSIIAFGLISSPAFAKKESCMKEPLGKAFQIRAIKSELMITALLCRTQDDYNKWGTENKSVLSQNDKIVDSHFKRKGIAAYDRYTTDLANEQERIRHTIYGNEYCVQRENIYKDAGGAMADKNITSAYMVKYHMNQVKGYEQCKK